MQLPVGAILYHVTGLRFALSGVTVGRGRYYRVTGQDAAGDYLVRSLRKPRWQLRCTQVDLELNRWRLWQRKAAASH